MPAWVGFTALGVWIVKDTLLFPMVRRSYEPGDHVPGNELLGLSGRADDDLDPGGYVRVRHELWRAEAAEGSPAIRAGEEIRVVALDGLTLIVRAEADPEPEPSR
ncbi:MAG: NfeD family protein [Myxococcota bacterium]|nr:NfeD family protein [Myxococcota bacterium]